MLEDGLALVGLRAQLASFLTTRSIISTTRRRVQRGGMLARLWRRIVGVGSAAGAVITKCI